MLTIQNEEILMTPTELAKRLAHMYDNARQGETATMVHLFGIRYADELRRCGETPLRHRQTCQYQ